MCPIRLLPLLLAIGSSAAVAQSLLDVDHRRDLGPAESAAVSIGVFQLDFDRDGRSDLLFAAEYAYLNDRAALRRNVGDGRFEPVAASNFRGWFYVSCVADLDGDGTTEYAGEGGIWTIAHDGSMSLAVPGVGGGAGVFGDVDGDGDLDVVSGGRDLALFLQTGPLVFTASTSLSGIGGTALAFGDCDADGDLDLLVARDRATNGLFLNDGSGIFTDASHQLPTNATATIACALRDLDGDGHADALFLDGRGGGMQLLYRRGGAFVDASHQLPIPSGDHRGFAIGDIDADGHLDVVVASGIGGSVARGTGTGWFLAVPDGWPGSRANLCVGLFDVDADGDLDLVEGGAESNDRVHFNDGTGRFVGPADRSQRFPWSGVREHRYAAMVDIDRDGDLDVLAPRTMWRNDGFGHFDGVPSSAPSLPTARHASVAVGDVDGDHHVDLVVPSAYDRFRIHHGDGVGGFRAGAEYVAPVSPPNPPYVNQRIEVLALDDLDGDGDLDLVCGASEYLWGPPPTAAFDTLWWNDGRGVFVEDRAWCTTGAQFGKDVAFGDLNNDGRTDFTDGVRTFVQRADHRFDLVAPDPTGWLYTGNNGAVALADLDGDGDLDVVEANSCAGTPFCEGIPDAIGWNDGTGSFRREQIGNDRETFDVALLDADADGDVDIYFGRVDNGVHGIGPNELLINEGNRVFRPARYGDEVAEVWRDTWQVLAGDVDADGDVDLFTLDSAYPADDSHGVLWNNMTRHLEAPDLLRVGWPYLLELHGVVRGGAILGAPVLARVSVPPIGTLGLHPDAIAVFATFAAPGTGRRADLGLLVPPVPALVGVRYAFQGLVLDGSGAPALTNRVVETFLGN